MRFLSLCSLLLIISAVSGQEDDVVVIDQRPVVFPDAMKALPSSVPDVMHGAEQIAWFASISAFLGNNSTDGLNFTPPLIVTF
jgi:hypothetical protein